MADPSKLTILRSHPDAWDVEITDPQGVSHIDLSYGRLPYTYKWRELPANCPKSVKLTIPKTRKFFFRTMPFESAAVCDCSKLDNGAFLVTHFRFDTDGSVNARPAHERTPDMQRILDAWEIQSHDEAWRRYMMRPILIVLLALILLVLMAIWAGLGPLFGG